MKIDAIFCNLIVLEIVYGEVYNNETSKVMAAWK